MKKLITISITLLTFAFASAQEKGIIISPDDRNACYLYAVAESPLNDNCKILIISSYIHRQKYKKTDGSDKLSNASSSYFGGLVNAFNKKLDDVILNERMNENAGKGLDIIFRSDKEESFKSSVYAEGHCPINYMNYMPKHQSTRLFSKDCRERFIREKMKEGYHVYQLTFDEYYERHYDLLYNNTPVEINLSV